MRGTLFLKALFPQQTHQSKILVDLSEVEDCTVVHPDHRGRVGVVGRTNAALSHPVHWQRGRMGVRQLQKAGLLWIKYGRVTCTLYGLCVIGHANEHNYTISKMGNTLMETLSN